MILLCAGPLPPAHPAGSHPATTASIGTAAVAGLVGWRAVGRAVCIALLLLQQPQGPLAAVLTLAGASHSQHTLARAMLR